ncbi:MAG: hypothetical protein OQL09_10220 [Gammaproteobacteria bacterium]|nr:hypothetical protein [Gammaproteobacteria bacterium]
MNYVSKRCSRLSQILLAIVLLLSMADVYADDFSFDLSEFEKQPFKINSFVELLAEYQWLDETSAGYFLKYPDANNLHTLDRYASALELSASYQKQNWVLDFTAHASSLDSEFEDQQDVQVYEALVKWQRDEKLLFELGKKAIKWGKGYAWNPVAFLERPKDPSDPELTREGFVVVAGEWIHSGEGNLKTLALTPVLVPVENQLNSDFGEEQSLNPALKLYLLYRDIDIDVMYLAEGSRSQRWGLDFSANLATNLEIHGEVARIYDQSQSLLQLDNNLTTEVSDINRYLLGLRYLTASELTVIAEYYYNGGGYSQSQAEQYFQLVHAAADTGDSSLNQLARAAASAGFNSSNFMQSYVYLKFSQKEPFDIVYLITSLIVIDNLDDGSYSLIPELIYTGVTNLELRLRMNHSSGGQWTEYGEKTVQDRLELRIRYYF